MRRKILEKFEKWKVDPKRMPLLLFGARQVGKTYILEEFGKSFENFHLINFEKNKVAHNAFSGNLDPKTIIQKLEIDLKIQIQKDDLLIFDEIQECPTAITSLKYFCEDLPSQAVVAAGSLLGVRIVETSFPVGKVDMLYMQPMSFEEFLLAKQEEKLHQLLQETNLNEHKTNIAHERLWDIFKEYLIVGGMPKAVKEFTDNYDNLANAYDKAILEQEKIINAYYIDIGKYCGKENAMHIRRILENIPEQLAQRQDGNSGRYKFKGVIPRKDQYSELVGSIDWLEAAGLVHRVQLLEHIDQTLPAYSRENFFKLYIFDVGLLRYLSRLDYNQILQYDFGTYKGYIAENFVLQELIYASEGRKKFFSWSQNTAEIEFLLDSRQGITPIEVKSGGNLKSKSLYAYSKRYEPKSMVILSGRSITTDEYLIKYPLYLSYKLPQLFMAPL